MDDPNITMGEYIRLEEEKARKRGKMFNWKTAKYGKIEYDDDIHDLRSVETEFPAIVFDDNLTFEETLSCQPTVSSLHNNEIDFRISFDESDDEDYTVVFDKNSFSYKIIPTNDLKTDLEDDNEEVNMPSFPSPKPTEEERDHILRFSGQWSARFVKHFGLMTICEEINDTWAWVALGPERQPDATAGAPKAIEDAPADDEGAQAVPAPIQAPQ
ncbi:hypothetical protein Tco_1079224 [Tanacetum coccineum]|uniref:Uncharacterized protein n=1 Tax=Tanacetum coccineum TaxID=301880 RepID=A0ABQ5HS47_9ASTR